MTQRIVSLLGLALLCCFGCTEDDPGPVPRIELAAELTPVSAFGGTDGAIDLRVEGGVPPYLYAWNTGAETEDLAGLTSGIYAVTVVDGASAVGEATFAVDQPVAPPLTIQFTVGDATRFGAADGTLAASVSGGTLPYAYAWSNGATAAELTGITAGWYRVTVTDGGAQAIVTVDSAFVGEPAFVCGRDSITDVDGNRYPTVQLGDHCWTAENLRTRHHPKRPTESLDGLFCDGLNCTNANGGHYDWATARTGATTEQDRVRGVCPCEWHLPSVAEWTALSEWLAVDGNGGPGRLAAAKLRGPMSSSGFNARYAGNWGFPLFAGETAAFWTATPGANGTTAAYRLLTPTLPIVAGGDADPALGLSVRCVRD